MSVCKGYVDCWWRDFKYAPMGTALEQAVKSNDLDSVKDLLNDHIPQSIKNIALFRAIDNNDIHIVYELLTAQADPNAQLGPDDVPILNYAVDHGNFDIVKLLLNFGADPNLEDGNNLKAIDRATEAGFTSIFDLLLPISKIRMDHNQLSLAVSINDDHMVHELLNQGADPNQISSSGNNALHEATYAGYTPIVELLLQYGADPTIKNIYQTTAKDIAIDMGFDDIVELIDDYLLSSLKEPDN
jgi:ankyrin repeat protein